MPRKQKVTGSYEVDLEGKQEHQESAVGFDAPHHQVLIDPLAPMSGAIKMVSDQRAPKRKPGQAKAAKEVYQLFLRNLVALNGNEVQALSATLGLNQSDVENRAQELKDSIIANATTGRSLQDILKVYNINKEARIAILASHAFSSVPAASLKAIDMLNDLDAGRVADEASYESYVRRILYKR